MRLKLLLICSIWLLSACVYQPSAETRAYVDLDELEPLPTSQDSDVLPLKVAIAAVISPAGSAESYAPLLDYLSEKLGRPVESVQRNSYSEINELVRTGEVDLAFVCTSSYILGRREFGMQLLVAPQVNGEAVYRSNLIVPSDSTATHISDLRGTVFAFTDPISFSGRWYPTYYLLQELDETPGNFFDRTFFTYSHDEAIYAVANHIADSAAVDSLVLDFLITRDPRIESQIRVIHTSEPFGIPPVVIGPEIRPQLRAQLEDILLNMHTEPAGLAALQALDIDRFVLVSEDIYSRIEEIETTINSCETCAE
ncbi:MAG: phosphate/phosphite/phosphonate ABC transporter substrate-binding protein [Chloroflexi bacterium]|nr:phosphate/phosphite/phosphonate ABC transporter substrate-binding protein [Chloroflexota bacterium]